MRPSLVSGEEPFTHHITPTTNICSNYNIFTLFLSVICERERNLSRRQCLYLDDPVMAIFI